MRDVYHTYIHTWTHTGESRRTTYFGWPTPELHLTIRSTISDIVNLIIIQQLITPEVDRTSPRVCRAPVPAEQKRRNIGRRGGRPGGVGAGGGIRIARVEEGFVARLHLGDERGLCRCRGRDGAEL